MEEILNQIVMGFFIIKKIEILPECSIKIRKNLKPGSYPFASNLERGFFGQNITVQAIVGMNGSGKSSLLEIMFRMINNFFALLTCETEYYKQSKLCLVSGIHADLFFSADDNESILSIRDLCAAFSNNELNIRLGKSSKKYFPKHILLSKISAIMIERISKDFFYTVVTNYSLQAYISDDYKNEKVFQYNQHLKKWEPSHNQTWLDNLYHKNDSYLTPINLNPFRENGCINMNDETQLTMSRVTSLLIEFKRRDEDFISGYELKNIEYVFSKAKVVNQFDSVGERESISSKYNRILKLFRLACSPAYPLSYANIILNGFRINKKQLETADDIIIAACLYVVNQVLSIASRHPYYSRFSHLSTPSNSLILTTSKSEKTQVKYLTKQVRHDRSHISFKVWQAVNFIKNGLNNNDLSFLHKKFTYQEYVTKLGFKDIDYSIYERIHILPPSFFIEDIKLYKKEGGKCVSVVPFRKLSSGERQFLFSTSCIIYHLMNLRSVRKGQPIYRNYNVVLDEVEICFHPEYQRTFLKDFIFLIHRSGIVDRCGINILLTTHSPFILSDIPQSNILYLENGTCMYPNTYKNPFAANVNDILYQDFFMKNGFMGALAQQKIKKLINFLSTYYSDNREVNMEISENLIDLVGDPLLKSRLISLLNSFYLRNPELRSKKSNR